MASSMKVHQLPRGLLVVDHHEPSLSLGGCKRFCPLAPKLSGAATAAAAGFDIKSFIRPESGPRKLGSSDDSTYKSDSPPVETTAHPGGTRWNPTQEQIGILEMLYKGGMRTPNARQIEQITQQLGKYGKIEGKNVFYWFQNHKARERQKQKRLGLISHGSRTASAISATHILSLDTREEGGRDEDSPYKRKCRSWSLEFLGDDDDDERRRSCKEEEDYRTLELFPLHPESR